MVVLGGGAVSYERGTPVKKVGRAFRVEVVLDLIAMFAILEYYVGQWECEIRAFLMTFA